MESEKKATKVAMTEEEFLNSLTHWAGFTPEEIADKFSISRLEVCLESLDTMHYISSFENLKSLTLVALNIERIEGLNRMVSLEEIWLDQNQISKIEGLEFNVNLKKLFLSNNNIEIIEGLDNLQNLEVLWLNENKIQNLQGLGCLKNLQQLWIGQNQIAKIGSDLSQLRKLEDLNIAGNCIGSFKEVLCLTSLPSLTILALNDPHFNENPVCNLCNYQTYMIFQLPQLKKLDTFLISEEAQNYAEATFMKKKMYYNMRIKTIKRTCSNIKLALIKLVQKFQTHVFSHMAPIEEDLNMAERELDERKSSKPIRNVYTYGEDELPINPLDSVDQEELKDLLERKISRRKDELKQANNDLLTVDKISRALHSKADYMCKENISRLITELETGGNIRFEEGKTTDNWYTSCVDLMLSRYQGPPQIKVTRVTRIHNRYLRNRFEERLETVADTTESAYKRNLEYLFYGIDANAPNELNRVMEEGFRTPGEYKELGLPACVPLVNSVHTAELSRLIGVDSELDTIYRPSGHILICKVYIGEGVEDSKISTYKARMTVSDAWDQSPIAKPENSWAAYRQRDDDPKNKIWFIFDNHIVLPEYLVEFEYTHSELSADPDEMEWLEMTDLEKSDLNAFSASLTAFMDLCNDDSDTYFEQISPDIPTRSALDDINDEIMRAISGEQSASKITSLNLSLNNLISLQNVGFACNLERLCLNFNMIESLEDLRNLKNLSHLEISHNNIKSVEYVGFLKNLVTLDISHNAIDDIRCLFNFESNKKLTNLVMIGNEVSLHSRYRQVILINVPSLEEFDYEFVSSDEKEIYSNSNQAINMDVIRAHYLTDSSFLLSETSHFETLSTKTLMDWVASAENLRLDSEKLTSLSGIEQFSNLRKLSLIGNMIQEISFIDRCPLLEELSLEDNMISKIGNLNRLIYLKKLDLGRNFISKVEGLEKLECLTQLSLEDNLISSLEGVEELQGIMELYIGNNRIKSLKDILLLRDLPKLIILDVSGNPLTKEQSSRLYIIFFLKKLKVLDGIGIEQAEQSYARDEFGGRLSEDLLETRLSGLKKSEIRNLDLSSAKLRAFDDMFTGEIFPLLIEINLSDNQIQTLRCFGFMPNLIKLQLSKNKLESLHSIDGKGLQGLPNLETLDVSFNQLLNLSGLQNCKLPNLKVLICAHNKIESIEYLDNLTNLRELDLCANNIKQIDPTSFPSALSLRYLRLDENKIRVISNLNGLVKLQCLQLISNRVTDYIELEKLRDLPTLMELALSNNPITRKLPYRISVIKRLPQLMFLDGQEVQVEERERGEMVQEVKPPPMVHLAPQPAQKVPVRLTSVNVEAVFGKNDPNPAKRPISSANFGILGVTPINSHLKSKNQKQKK